MKKKYHIVTLFFVLTCVLSSCSIPFSAPESGQYYCTELQMTLDFDNDNVLSEKDNELIVLQMDIGYDSYIYIQEPIVEEYPSAILSGRFIYVDDKIIIKTQQESYSFFKVREG